MPFLTVSRLQAGYESSNVLSEISFEAEKAEVVAVVGANGAGKSTLLKAVSGVLPCRAGEVRLEGHDITSMSAQQRSIAGVALCPEGRGIFNSLSVRENLMMGAVPLYRRESSRAAKELVASQFDYAFDLFPFLVDKSDQLGGSLSGGQQQMLAIARALMSKPRLLLLDEPSMGLAPTIASTIFSAIRSLAAEYTILVCEEKPAEVCNIAQRAVLLRGGRLMSVENPRELVDRTDLTSTYFGVQGKTGS